jgi:hypothetical protein
MRSSSYSTAILIMARGAGIDRGFVRLFARSADPINHPDIPGSVEGGLLANAVCQPIFSSPIYRIRQQAGSYSRPALKPVSRYNAALPMPSISQSVHVQFPH